MSQVGWRHRVALLAAVAIRSEPVVPWCVEAYLVLQESLWASRPAGALATAGPGGTIADEVGL